jgi:phosphotransferase system  glucose/maltose/N-acetylglucosamine-specific IIC component
VAAQIIKAIHNNKRERRLSGDIAAEMAAENISAGINAILIVLVKGIRPSKTPNADDQTIHVNRLERINAKRATDVTAATGSAKLYDRAPLTIAGQHAISVALITATRKPPISRARKKLLTITITPATTVVAKPK